MLPADTGGKQGARACSHARRASTHKNRNDMENEKLKELAGQVADNVVFTTKEVLTSQEAARYMGISLSHLYKLTMRQQIPHYKPMGKMCYFNRHELEEWLQTNRVNTAAEAARQAQSYCMRKGGAL